MATKTIETQSGNLPKPATLPATGKSRFANFKPYCPISREKFRQLARDGKAPQPERMGIRCTYYDNGELHRFLADPANYSVVGKTK
jgi:prophage regulatory protein